MSPNNSNAYLCISTVLQPQFLDNLASSPSQHVAVLWCWRGDAGQQRNGGSHGQTTFPSPRHPMIYTQHFHYSQSTESTKCIPFLIRSMGSKLQSDIPQYISLLVMHNTSRSELYLMLQRTICPKFCTGKLN